MQKICERGRVGKYLKKWKGEAEKQKNEGNDEEKRKGEK